MENLIHDLIYRLETVKGEEKMRILQYKENGVDDAAKILTGKIIALDYCIGELKRMASYAHQTEINH